MKLRTFRAATMHEALALVRRELGPNAAVLHTRNVRSRWLGLLPGPRQIEVTASRGVNVPSRLPSHGIREKPAAPCRSARRPTLPKKQSSRTRCRGNSARCRRWSKTSAGGRNAETVTIGPASCSTCSPICSMPSWAKTPARELIESVRSDPRAAGLSDPLLLKNHLAGTIEADIRVAGPIMITPGRCRLAALVGPTGVGKTTTIAKLAANFRLKEKRRVGLITVDTYRIAAVEQLRTYADIIDLPMHVVATPREMRQTVERMSHLDLILLDTAGRSPKDEVRIQELKAFLAEAAADEVHLVLSSVAAARTLAQTAERFAAVGATAMVLTKLDEANGLGNLLPLVRSSGLPLSYLTDGQNVPDDIQLADAHRLAQMILGVCPAAEKLSAVRS